MARRSRGFRASRGPKNNVWTVVILNKFVVQPTPDVSLVVEGADWTGAAGHQRATLLRIRGWLSVAPVATATVANAFHAAIYISEADAPITPDPGLATMYNEEDVLWMWGAQFSAGNAGAVERPTAASVIIDVKAMRKITSTQEVRITIASDASGGLTCSHLLRGLIRKGGN